MMYMDDAIRATLELMDAPADSIGEARGGYNVSGISFTAGELAETISERVDGFTCRSEEHTSELQSLVNLVCRLRLEKKKIKPAQTS